MVSGYTRFNLDHGQVMSVPSSTSRASIIDRLTRENRPDLIAAIEGGKISAYGVAVAMGWKKRPPILGRGSTNRAKRRDAMLGQLGLNGNGKLEPDGELSLRESIEGCELAWGPDASGSVFSSMEQVREAWARLGPVVSATCHRPYAAEVLARLDRKKKAPTERGPSRDT
jgi:hypothetical protein